MGMGWRKRDGVNHREFIVNATVFTGNVNASSTVPPAMGNLAR